MKKKKFLIRVTRTKVFEDTYMVESTNFSDAITSWTNNEEVLVETEELDEEENMWGLELMEENV